MTVFTSSDTNLRKLSVVFNLVRGTESQMSASHFGFRDSVIRVRGSIAFMYFLDFCFVFLIVKIRITSVPIFYFLLVSSSTFSIFIVEVLRLHHIF